MGCLVRLQLSAVEQMINTGADGRHDRRLPPVCSTVLVAIGKAVAGAHVRIDGQEEVRHRESAPALPLAVFAFKDVDCDDGQSANTVLHFVDCVVVLFGLCIVTGKQIGRAHV